MQKASYNIFHFITNLFIEARNVFVATFWLLKISVGYRVATTHVQWLVVQYIPSLTSSTIQQSHTRFLHNII